MPCPACQGTVSMAHGQLTWLSQLRVITWDVQSCCDTDATSQPQCAVKWLRFALALMHALTVTPTGAAPPRWAQDRYTASL